MPKPKKSEETVVETQQPPVDLAAEAGPGAEIPPPQKAIFSAIANIMRELAVKGISKDQKVTQGGNYNFRGIDDILNILSGLFVKNNLLVRVRYFDRTLAEYLSKSQTRMVNVSLAGVYQLISTVDGSALDFGPFYGEGMDSGDKATNKAMAICFKYFAIQTFVIPIVGNDDPDFTVPEEIVGKRGVAPAQQTTKAVAAEQQSGPESVEQAIKRLATTQAGRKKLVEAVTGAYSVVSVDQIPDDKRAEAIAKMEIYVAKVKAAARKKS
jgi:hypothetical protein